MPALHVWILSSLTLAAATATAQAADRAAADDPLHSTECRRALDALQAQEAASASAPPSGAAEGLRRPRPADPKLEAARRVAASACLRSRDDPPAARQPYVQAPIAVSPAPTARRTPPIPVPREPPAPVARPAERPRFITTCDAIGCWADDGSRLDRIGPDLRGPRGPCTAQGTLLTCP
ncbi:MAG TPA: hypothetical protein VHM00_18610 [Caldimonas sp.]|jgi:hypothetical protein|nr:hypothetical protein [Caldimonas sp.]HEX2543080.1 hypothetical protein [Caldimonas sp.]